VVGRSSLPRDLSDLETDDDPEEVDDGGGVGDAVEDADADTQDSGQEKRAVDEEATEPGAAFSFLLGDEEEEAPGLSGEAPSTQGDSEQAENTNTEGGGDGIRDVEATTGFFSHSVFNGVCTRHINIDLVLGIF
jgi:hypothetical protein